MQSSQAYMSILKLESLFVVNALIFRATCQILLEIDISIVEEGFRQYNITLRNLGAEQKEGELKLENSVLYNGKTADRIQRNHEFIILNSIRFIGVTNTRIKFLKYFQKICKVIGALCVKPTEN